MLSDLLTARHDDALLVAYPEPGQPPFTDEEMKVCVRRGRVADMRKDLPAGETDGENVGIVKFSASSVGRLISHLDRNVELRGRRDWAPRAFADFAGEQPLYAVEHPRPAVDRDRHAGGLSARHVRGLSGHSRCGCRDGAGLAMEGIVTRARFGPRRSRSARRRTVPRQYSHRRTRRRNRSAQRAARTLPAALRRRRAETGRPPDRPPRRNRDDYGRWWKLGPAAPRVRHHSAGRYPELPRRPRRGSVAADRSVPVPVRVGRRPERTCARQSDAHRPRRGHR